MMLRPVGASGGSILVWTTSADGSWNNWNLMPNFVPLVVESALHLALPPGHRNPTWLVAGQPIEFSTPADRPTVPIVLFVWGPGRIVPVRITSYSVEEQLFLPSLRVLQARVSLSMTVLTPDVFKCASGPSVALAIAAYNFYRGQQDALALINLGTSVGSLRAMLPF